MSKPVLYLFNGKVARFGSSLIGKPVETTPTDEVTIGDITWKTTDLDIDDGGSGIYHNNGKIYYTQTAAQRVVNTLTGWTIPSKATLLSLTVEDIATLGLSTVDGRYYCPKNKIIGEGSYTDYGTTEKMFSDVLYAVEFKPGKVGTEVYPDSNGAFIYRIIKVTQ